MVFVVVIQESTDRRFVNRFSQAIIMTNNLKLDAVGLHTFLIDEFRITAKEAGFTPSLDNITRFQGTFFKA